MIPFESKPVPTKFNDECDFFRGGKMRSPLCRYLCKTRPSCYQNAAGAYSRKGIAKEETTFPRSKKFAHFMNFFRTRLEFERDYSKGTDLLSSCFVLTKADGSGGGGGSVFVVCFCVFRGVVGPGTLLFWGSRVWRPNQVPPFSKEKINSKQRGN